MNVRTIASLALAVSFGLAPSVLARDKDKSRSASTKPASVRTTKAEKVKPSKTPDRAATWHGKDWKRSTTPTRTAPSNAVHVVQYRAPAGAPSTQPEGAYTYSLTDKDARYDYFAAHYGSHGTGVASSQPATVLGYVPPDNAHNPFIYRRGK